MMKTINIRKLQLKELEILKDFDAFCRKHDLKYCLAGGTLLGAVRHKGFIPWDDDIDIYMPRPDYIKFNQIYNSKYTLKSPLVDKQWHYPFAKLMNMEIKLVEDNTSKITGVWVDIFPADGWPTSYEDSVNYHKKQIWLERIVALRNAQVAKSKRGSLITLAKFLFIRPLRLTPEGLIVCYIDRKSSQKFSYADSEFVGNVVWPGEKIIRVNKGFFNDRTELLFEDASFYAPANYHDYLVQAYGNYMKVPHVSERINHNIVIV